MPLIARRTPQSEETSTYGYRDLLKDIMRKISTGATSNVERMTSGGMSNEEILETALAPAGGMLKIGGTSKLLAGLLARQQGSMKTITAMRAEKMYAQGRNVFKEALKVPEKEYGRLKNISWGSMAGEALGTKGIYDPWKKKISLHPTLADAETVWHEFVHGRQANPEYMSPMLGQDKWGILEATHAQNLRELHEKLLDVARSHGVGASDFYYKVSPTERMARGVAAAVKKYPRDFETLFKRGLESEVTHSREILRRVESGETLGDIMRTMSFPRGAK